MRKILAIAALLAFAAGPAAADLTAGVVGPHDFARGKTVVLPHKLGGGWFALTWNGLWFGEYPAELGGKLR